MTQRINISSDFFLPCFYIQVTLCTCEFWWCVHPSEDRLTLHVSTQYQSLSSLPVCVVDAGVNCRAVRSSASVSKLLSWTSALTFFFFICIFLPASPEWHHITIAPIYTHQSFPGWNKITPPHVVHHQGLWLVGLVWELFLWPGRQYEVHVCGGRNYF